MKSNLLEVKNLTVSFETSRGQIEAVQNISFSLKPGEALGLVGESGSGKSVTSLAIMDLLPAQGKIKSGDVLWQGQSLLKLNESEKQKIRGSEIAMIFQDAMTSLNPCFTAGDQLIETLKLKHGGSKSSLKEKARELLVKVGITEPDDRLRAYPHQLSGGMSQRVMIAMAIACQPKLLIADEPTTALDVTIQAQILALLNKLRKEQNMALIMISHDLGVIAETTEQVIVLYAGQMVEKGLTQNVIQNPSHPYTEGLLKSLPSLDSKVEDVGHLPSIPGVVPDLAHRPQGCQLNPRCIYVQDKCREQEPPQIVVKDRVAKCWTPIQKDM